MRAAAFLAIWLCGAATTASAVVATRGMVSSEHALASEAGVSMLRQGGNAVDAAVAAALAVGVVNPSSCGIGGGGFMVIFHRRTNSVAALDYRETAPAAATRDMFIRDGRPVPELSLSGGLAVAVPGEVAGLVAAHRRFGVLPFATVAGPAIAYARDGFPIGSHLAETITKNLDRIRQHPELAEILLRPDGSAPAVGEPFRQTALADTLDAIAHHGRNAFYGGAVAAAIVDSVGAAGGILQRTDLASYRPKWRRPLHTRFHGYEVYSMPPPSSGGGVLIEALNILRRDDLAALEQNSVTYLHLLAGAMQFGFADRAAYYGDPDFVAVPIAMLLSEARGQRQRRLLSAATTFSPEIFGSVAGTADAGTSHLSVIDRWGNAVACTTTINTAFGSLLVAKGTGIILNNEMDDFAAQPGAPNVYGLIGSEANSIAPRKRPLSSMTPTVVVRSGNAVAALGGSGGPLITSATLQALLNTLVFRQDAATALATPRIHHQWVPPVLLVEPGIDRDRRAVLVHLGHRITESSALGAVQLVQRSPDGVLDGAADARKGGKAIGW